MMEGSLLEISSRCTLIESKAIRSDPNFNESNIKEICLNSEAFDNDDHDVTLLAENEHHQACQVKSKNPSFDKVYEEFEKFQKRKEEFLLDMNSVHQSETLQAIQLSLANRKQLPAGGSLVGSMNSFMATHSPVPGFFTTPSLASDWSSKASELLKEFKRLQRQPKRNSKVWGCAKRIDFTENELTDQQSSNQDDNSSLFTTPEGSIPNSDDDVAFSYVDMHASIVAGSGFPPIGHLSRRFSQHSCRSLSQDSGYQSTEHSGASDKPRGSQSSLAEEFDEVLKEISVNENAFDYKPVSPIKPPREPFFVPYNNWMYVSYPAHSFVEVQPYPVSDMSTKSSTSLLNSIDEGCGGRQRHKKWITEEILEMIAVRDKLYKRMKKYPSPDIVCMYKKIRNMVVGMTRNAKRAYEKKEKQYLRTSNEDHQKKNFERILTVNCSR